MFEILCLLRYPGTKQVSSINIMNLYFDCINTAKLKNKQIIDICLLKKQHWNFSLKEQLIFFKKYIKNKDLNCLVFKKKKLVGYTLLRKKKLPAKKNYLHFDTLVVDKKLRKKKVGKKLMEFNNTIIKKEKSLSILFCKNSMIAFYKKNGWKLSKFKFKKNKKNIMYFNLENSKIKKINKKIIDNINV